MKSIKEIALKHGYSNELVDKYCNCDAVGYACLFCSLMQLIDNPYVIPPCSASHT